MEPAPRPPNLAMDHRTSNSPSWYHAQKKSLQALERDPWKRAVFVAEQAGVDADALVVLDEVGSNLDLTRRFGRSKRGTRLKESIPHGTPQNTSTIASITTTGMGPALVLNGSVTRPSFETYLEQVLGPTLRPGQVIVLDNARIHHGGRVEAIIAARGCRIWYLPPYSPDFSPIELAFAKVKGELRRLKARTTEALERAIAFALSCITGADARAFFAHCGYPLWPIRDQ